MYNVDYTKQALKDLHKLRKSDYTSYVKALKLLDELSIHPTYGTGKPKPLSGDRVGQWSRRITDKHRLVYKIEDDILVVLVLSTVGHYDDK